MVAELKESLGAIPVAPLPMGAISLTKAEKLARYAQMRDDPKAWQEMLKSKPFGEVIQYAESMEKQFKTQDIPAPGIPPLGEEE